VGEEVDGAQKRARVLMYAITGYAPGATALVEALQACEESFNRGVTVVLVLEDVKTDVEFSNAQAYSPTTIADLNKAREVLKGIATLTGVKVIIRTLPPPEVLSWVAFVSNHDKNVIGVQPPCRTVQYL
jgi:hypothetical protein